VIDAVTRYSLCDENDTMEITVQQSCGQAHTLLLWPATRGRCIAVIQGVSKRALIESAFCNAWLCSREAFDLGSQPSFE
jgi:hypothetical protein